MQGRFRRAIALLATLAIAGMAACAERDWVLPDPADVSAWYGEGTEARIDGNVVEISGIMEPDHLRRGGRTWARSGPYFYLFTTHVQDLLRDYPDVAAVRVRTLTIEGEEIASVMLLRRELSEVQWREALARRSLAQLQGSRNPRTVERLTEYGEEHTHYEYQGIAR